jgi:drug/metabolite transporter (DMT)-like permease
LNFIGWAGIFAALVIVVALTRYNAANFGTVDRVAVALFNFCIALLLLVLFAGPFLLRRTKRGLKSLLD